jgi:uncharacterized protein (TIGR00156 family)
MLFFVSCLLSLFTVLIGSCQDSTGPEVDPYSQPARDAATLSPTAFGPDANSPLPPLDPYGNPPPPPSLDPNGNPPPPPLDPYGNPPLPPSLDPNGNPPPPPLDPYEFTASAQHVTVEQAKSSAHGTPVIVTGNLIQAIGGDSYIFRDSSGTINMRIGPREWEIYGSTISMSDLIEISGELHREPGNRKRSPEIHIHARYIRKL